VSRNHVGLNGNPDNRHVHQGIQTCARTGATMSTVSPWTLVLSSSTNLWLYMNSGKTPVDEWVVTVDRNAGNRSKSGCSGHNRCSAGCGNQGFPKNPVSGMLHTLVVACMNADCALNRPVL
jgi:hypothetical protein